MSEILTHHETKLIRPFDQNINDLEGALDDIELRLHEDDDAYRDSMIILRPEAIKSATPALLVKIDVPGIVSSIKAVQLKESQVQFAVVCSVSGLKYSDVLYKGSLKDISAEISLDSAIPYLAAKDGLDISVLLTLTEDLAPKPLRPTSKGQWLARKIFQLRQEKPADSFNVVPLTEAVREQFKLPKGLAHYVQVEGSANDPEVKLSEIVTVWLDEGAYNSLAKHGGDSAASAMQLALVADVITTIVIRELVAEANLVLSKGSPLESLCMELSKHSGKSPEALLGMARNDVARFKSTVESYLSLGRAIKEAF
jgi:hypothetical protein